ncbi:MAG: hypothetical protein ACK5AC_07930 [Planctomycetota bacterium]|jgi:hypothetical protein
MKATKNVFFIWLTALFLAVGRLVCFAVASDNEAALENEFFAALVSMQSKYDQLQFNVRCSLEDSSSGDGISGERRRKTEYEFAKNGDCYISIREVEKSKGLRAKILRCSNGSYAFAIDKTTSPPSLVYLERLGVDAAIDERVANQKKNEFDAPIKGFHGHMFLGKLLPDLINSPDFSLKKLAKRDVLGKAMVELEFEYNGFDAEHNDKYQLTDGKLLLDPTNDWVVVSASWIYESLKDGEKGRATSQREYNLGREGCPMASNAIGKYESLSTRYVTEDKYTIEWKRQEVPKEEFFLTFYGFPEPQFDRSFLEKWGWWLIGGIVFLGTGCWLTMRRSTK